MHSNISIHSNGSCRTNKVVYDKGAAAKEKEKYYAVVVYTAVIWAPNQPNSHEKDYVTHEKKILISSLKRTQFFT